MNSTTNTQAVNLDHLNFTVNNLKDSEEFYQYFFGFEKVEAGGQGIGGKVPWAILRSGNSMLCLSEYPNKKQIEDTKHLQVNHFAFSIQNAEEFARKIKERGIKTYYDSPVHYPHSQSWYIKDPSGYMIEVAAWNDGQVKF